MNKTEAIYRQLQKHIDNMPVGYPATESGVELRLLQHLFTPDEAAMALHLSALPESIDKIYSRAKKENISREKLEESLDRLADKGAIQKSMVDGVKHFNKMMLAIGMFEFQVNRLSKEYHQDFLQYMDEGFYKAFHTKKTSQMRTIPINEEVIPERKVGTYDGARELIKAAKGPFAVINCVCRQGMDLLEEPCKQTEIRETCLLIGNFAQMTIDTGNGRELTRDKMLEMLDQADDEGMVLQPQNSQDPHFICCCCGCCCGVLASAKKLPRPAEYFDANYYAKVDPDLCIGCGDCSTRCQMDAIIDDAEVSSVDLHRCIGCGLCVTTCPSEAVQLFRKTEAKIPPKDQDQLYRKILMERYGLLGMAKIMGKKVLGLKI